MGKSNLIRRLEKPKFEEKVMITLV